MRSLVYKQKTCEKCGNLYTPTSSTQSWCSACLMKPCAYCGKLFSVNKKSKYETATYCSASCRAKANGEKHRGENSHLYKGGNRTNLVKVVCSVCGKEIFRQQAQAAKWAEFICSGECRSKWMQGKYKGENSPKFCKVERICEWCGKQYLVFKAEGDKTRFCSKQCRNDWQSSMMSGENHYNWRGGVTEARHLDMTSREYKVWRDRVFQRDHYTCQMCGDNTGGNLNAHHIKAYKDFPDSRYDVDNGITLCKTCHIKVHKQRLDIQSEP